MKTTKPALSILRALFILFMLIVTNPLMAANPDNYSVTVRTRSTNYQNYSILAITENSLTICKTNDQNKNEINRVITLNATEIMQISTVRHTGRVLSYLIPIGVCTALGAFWGSSQAYKYDKQNPSTGSGGGWNSSGSQLNIGGIITVVYTALGVATGTVVGLIIDQGAKHRYSINMDPEKFASFRRKWGQDTNQIFKLSAAE